MVQIFHLAAQVSKMESSNLEDGDSIVSKYKSVNNDLTSKIKALKKAEGDLRKAESSVKKLTDSINIKDKKITELKNCNKRLSVMKEQATLTSSVRNNADSLNSVPKKVKCKDENTGKCRKSSCNNLHPQSVCQQFSMFGSCSLESVCELRHPSTSCFEWEACGSCRLGSKCRHRHPYTYHTGNYSDNFLVYGYLDPAGRNSQGWESPQLSPNHRNRGSQRDLRQDQRHHNLRRGRW